MGVMCDYMDTPWENDTATAVAIIRQRIRERLVILRQLQKQFEADNRGAFQNIFDLHMSTIRGLTPQSINSHAWPAILDDGQVVSLDDEAAENARDWVFYILCWHFHRDHISQARNKSFLKSAIEKEIRGQTEEWNDQERFFMALTDVGLDTWEKRLQTVFVVALQGNFAHRLAIIKNKASEHLERARRARTTDGEADDIRTKIINRAQTERVDHFACAVPLSTIGDMREHSDPDAACPICHHSFTDTYAYTIEELLADFPVRIKYCGHIIGKSCLKQWMDTPKIDKAKYPYRSCPLCRVKIEGVTVPAVPVTLRNHLKTNLTAIMNRRKLEEMSDFELNFEECVDAVSACMSEEVAAEQLMVVLSRKNEHSITKVEIQRMYLQEKLDSLKMERWAWGFRDNVAWKKAKDDWMISGIFGKL